MILLLAKQPGDTIQQKNSYQRVLQGSFQSQGKLTMIDFLMIFFHLQAMSGTSIVTGP
jgi:hypothetical protein